MTHAPRERREGIVSLAVWASVTLGLTLSCTSPRSPFDHAERDASYEPSVVDSSVERDAETRAGGGGAIETARVDAAITAPEPSRADAGATREPQCGDGQVTSGERCDIAIAPGKAGACPRQCPASKDPCRAVALRGSRCDVRCETTQVTARKAGDGCCPDGADAGDDHDCAAECGNGVIESGETCDPPASCQMCPAPRACVVVTSRGSATTCNASCSVEPVTACKSGDGCCPSGCGRANDTDCTARCGDGVVDAQAGETCETDGPRRCPQSCEDGDPCTRDTRRGRPESCDVSCDHTAISQRVNGDGCCPRGANTRNDSDCGNAAACMAGRERDACARCTCDRCAQVATSCRAGTSSTEATRCDAVARCISQNGCDGLECYCGDNVAACFLGIALGPCRAQIEAASEGAPTATILGLLLDGNSVFGRAIARSACEANLCRNDCRR